MQGLTPELPIDRELVRKRAYLPVKLAELSKEEPDEALDLLRAWGEGTKPITQLWDEASRALERRCKPHDSSEGNYGERQPDRYRTA
ncbi:hypothetical protein [Paenibacillus sp. BK720]|uniref:hypothetical protein n=1 Tax=Paenibacillus sp. BK720 TaxID=2587092 RepID=UPI00141F4245|nr:hypothetical protein [Paenibacillus sp. BK720]NIK67896.1 DNA polymerase/3'-5' exonuclease PolX [Paenibacillus sp. BK720]